MDVQLSPPARSRDGISALSGVLLAIILILYALCFSEMFIRIFAPQPLMPRYVTGSSLGIRGNIPYAVYWHETPDSRIEFRINGQGMRSNVEYYENKAPGVCRVAITGDSFMMGYELRLRDTIASVLETELKSAGYHIQVLNFAVSGYGTAEELISYEGKIRKFSPDILVLGWHGSDFTDNTRSDLFRLVGAQLINGNPTYLPSVSAQDKLMKFALYRYIADKSHLYSFVRERASRLISTVMLKLANRSEAGGSENAENVNQFNATPYDIGLSAALLQRFHGEVQKDNVSFYMVDIPRRIGRQDFRSTLTSFGPKVLDGLDIIYPTQVLMDAAKKEHLIFWEKGEGHFSPEGANLVATTIFEKIKSDYHLIGCK